MKGLCFCGMIPAGGRRKGRRTGKTRGGAESRAARNGRKKVSDEKKKGLFARLRQGLSKTRGNMTEKVDEMVRENRKVDEDFYEELEDILVMADCGLKATTVITIPTVFTRISSVEYSRTPLLPSINSSRLPESSIHGALSAGGMA